MPILQETQLGALADVMWPVMDLEGSFMFLIPNPSLFLAPLPRRLRETSPGLLESQLLRLHHVH